MTARSRRVTDTDEAATVAAPAEQAPSEDDARLVEALRAGDEEAFAGLVDGYHASMMRFALSCVSSRALAEEVVQDAWLGVLKGLPRFEGRSSLRTWIFRIVLNTAMTSRRREGRTVPFSSLAAEEVTGGGPSMEVDAFRPPGDRWDGHWTSYPDSWEPVPEERLLSSETLSIVRAAMEQLPAGQRTVLTLRDVEGWPASEVCNALEISETNQRVLLHRARSKVRRALSAYVEKELPGDG